MNAIVYECTYGNRSWECILSHIIKGKEVVGFTVTGRESRYQVYLVKLNGKQWIGIPEMGISSELSYLDDTFWNSEQIGHQLNSIIDGLTIANGVKLIGKL